MTQSLDILIEEQEAINELRKRLKNELPTKLYDDTQLLHDFLVARNFNVDQAELMLKKHVDFRKQIQLDTIVKDYKPPQILQEYLPQTLLGYDKQGCLIRYCPLGNLDGKGLFKSANATDILRCYMQVIQSDVETVKLLAKNTGKRSKKFLYIYNMENMTFEKARHTRSIEFYMHGLATFQDNFPEVLKSVFIVNAPLSFAMLFSLAKKFLAGSILNKIHVYGQEGYQEELLNEIDADILPAFLGGNRTDPDGNPCCNTIIRHAGMVPEKFYIKKNPELLLQNPGAQAITIPAKSDAKVTVYVESPDSILVWAYESSKSDINFALQFVESKDSKPETLLPLYKIETTVEPERGMYRCERSGTYIFIFDNTSSWFSSKQVYYLINVTKAKFVDTENYFKKIIY